MFRAWFVVFMFAVPAAVVAEGLAVTTLTGTVNEHFDTSARVAGSRLVSVRLGSARGLAFEPGNVQVVMPPSFVGVCVRSISRDGLYWMRTYYGVTAWPSATRLLIAPFTSDLDQPLRSYHEKDIAIVAFVSPDASCRDQTPVVLPVVVSLDSPSQLELLFNSGSRRISARLNGGVEVACVPPPNSERVAFDRICTLEVPLSGEPTQVVLHVEMDDGLTVTTEEYRIFLPAGQ